MAGLSGVGWEGSTGLEEAVNYLLTVSLHFGGTSGYWLIVA